MYSLSFVFAGIEHLHFVSLLSELGMMSPVWSVGSLTGQLQNVTLHFTTSEIEKPFFSSQ